MKNKANLSEDTDIDLDKLIESRMLIQANSGGGKSWSMRRFIEQSFGKKQIIIIDPEGEFGNMRSKFDFVYIGEGGDAPAEVRSAALLAKRLLETKANAIIDIYELGKNRGDFVKAFFEAVVNMPKELWTDCFFLLDEAHKFAPEKGQGESVALGAVIDMASLGRKRGYCLIPATQRPSKLSKDVVAECNNKLIGRASLDIDRERSAKELGFRTKEDILSLRDLKPGEFYVFGPAISNEVRKTIIGDIEVRPPKRGTGRSIKIAPPTAKVKKWLAELKDLPQEAEKELKTLQDFKKEIAKLRSHRCPKSTIQNDPNEIARAVNFALKDMRKRVDAKVLKYKRDIDSIFSKVGKIKDLIPETYPLLDLNDEEGEKFWGKSIADLDRPRVEKENKAMNEIIMSGAEAKFEIKDIKISDVEKILGKCSKAIYSYLVDKEGRALTKTQIAVAIGYSQKSSGFANSLSELSVMGLIAREGNQIFFKENDPIRNDLIIPVDTSLEKWSPKLGACSRKIWELILTNTETNWPKSKIAEDTGYYESSSGFANSLSELSSLGLIVRVGNGLISINPEILNL